MAAGVDEAARFQRRPAGVAVVVELRAPERLALPQAAFPVGLPCMGLLLQAHKIRAVAKAVSGP